MSVMTVPDIIRPFFRLNGAVIDLTANDFAARGKHASTKLAVKSLTALIDHGFVKIDKLDGFTAYRLTQKAIDPKSWPTMDLILSRGLSSDLRAVTRGEKRQRLTEQGLIGLMMASADATRARMRQLEKAIS